MVIIRAVRGAGLAWIRDVDWMVMRFAGVRSVVVVTNMVEREEEEEVEEEVEEVEVADEEMRSPGGTEGVAGGGGIVWIDDLVVGGEGVRG